MSERIPYLYSCIGNGDCTVGGRNLHLKCAGCHNGRSSFLSSVKPLEILFKWFDDKISLHTMPFMAKRSGRAEKTPEANASGVFVSLLFRCTSVCVLLQTEVNSDVTNRYAGN